MYFERGSYDPNARAEAQTRLQSFQGATSISSSQYFGRDEDEESAVLASSSAAGGGYLSEENLQNLGASARDALQRALANPDVQNISESLRTGALKVRSGVLVGGKEGPDRFWLIAVRLPGAIEPRRSMSALGRNNGVHFMRFKAHSSTFCSTYLLDRFVLYDIQFNLVLCHLTMNYEIHQTMGEHQNNKILRSTKANERGQVRTGDILCPFMNVRQI